MHDQETEAAAPEQPEAAADDVQLELDAMSAVARQLGALTPEARRRVLLWAAERYGVSTPAAAPSSGQRPRLGLSADVEAARDSSDADGDRSFGSLAELFDAVQPTQADQKGLTAAYWLQAVQGAQTLTGFAVNSELRQLGQEVKIAMAMSALQTRKPAFVLQLRKAGKTQQARKLYKVTEAGLRAVRNAIDNGGFSDW